MNRGVLSCWDAYPVPQSPLLRGDLAEEQQLDPPGAGTLSPARWSPNRLDFDVSLTRPARLVVNQNWHAGWRTNVGELVSDKGLLAVELPEGQHHVELRFQPRSALGGAAVAAAALLALGELARRARKARRVRAPREVGDVALAALAPVAAFGLAAWLLPHRGGPPPELRTLAGQPVVVDSLSESVMRIGARFEGGMTLEAASINNVNPTPGETIVLELDWRRDAKIASGLGVFVHIEPSKGDGISGDHVLLSSALDPDDAPPNRILRDLLPISVPQDARGKTWKVWVGLWLVRRGGERVHLLDRGRGVTDGDRILAGTFEPR